MADTETRLRAILDERIGVLDGAWGVLLQNRGLSEDDFRGERFRDHPRDLGRSRPAQPDAARHRRVDPPRLLRGRLRHHDDEHVHGDLHRPGGLRTRSRGLRDERRGRASRAASGGRLRRLRRRLDRAAERGAVAQPEGRRSGLPRSHLRPGRRVVRRADPRPARGRRRPAADRDDLRHAEREGGVVAAQDVAPELPLWISFTAIDRSGRNLSGQTSDAFWLSIEHAKPFIVGVNCSLGATEMRPFLESLARVATTYVSCHPNAGLPNALGGYDEGAHDTSRL